ncbi:hypothetical protein [Shimia sp.]|uniref:hypothetical protein n=1 Tax=Shimia sp. TaxID=1954381 RepID=UPI003BAC60A2
MAEHKPPRLGLFLALFWSALLLTPIIYLQSVWSNGVPSANADLKYTVTQARQVFLDILRGDYK